MSEKIRLEIDPDFKSIRTSYMYSDGKWSEENLRQFENNIDLYNFLVEQFTLRENEAKKHIDDPKKYLDGLYLKLDRILDEMSETDSRIKKLDEEINAKQKFLNYIPTETTGISSADPLSPHNNLKYLIEDMTKELMQMQRHKTEIFNKYQAILTEIKTIKHDEI